MKKQRACVCIVDDGLTMPPTPICLHHFSHTAPLGHELKKCDMHLPVPSAAKTHIFPARCGCLLLTQNKLPEKDPNWHIGRLKPWMVEDAMNLGLQYKEAGMTHRDPFQRVQQLEEACKMFNKVLELKPHDETARRHMGECCTAMNSDYQRMKGIKKMDKVGVEQGL